MGFYCPLWVFNGKYVFLWRVWVLMMIMGFNGDYKFLKAILGFNWRLCFFNGDYGFLMAIVGFY